MYLIKPEIKESDIILNIDDNKIDIDFSNSIKDWYQELPVYKQQEFDNNINSKMNNFLFQPINKETIYKMKESIKMVYYTFE